MDLITGPELDRRLSTCCVAKDKQANVDSIEGELEQHGVKPEQGADDQVKYEQRGGREVSEAQT